MKVTTKFATICTVGFSGPVSRDENRAAHGGVCLIQVRRGARGCLLARKVNANGRHREIGAAFAATIQPGYGPAQPEGRAHAI